MEKYTTVRKSGEPAAQGNAHNAAVAISNSVVNESEIIDSINSDVTERNNTINNINHNINREIDNIDDLLDTTNDTLTKLRNSL